MIGTAPAAGSGAGGGAGAVPVQRLQPRVNMETSPSRSAPAAPGIKALALAGLVGLGAGGAFLVWREARRRERRRELLPPLRTVPYVNLERYMGKWYEIAHLPHPFQVGCVATTATYSLDDDDGGLHVVNECRDRRFDGRLRRARGRAFATDPMSNARLQVQFFWPFRGDYWILDVGRDYEYAVVGNPDREYLWILSRFPDFASSRAAQYREILARARTQGFELSRLRLTPQPPAAAAVGERPAGDDPAADPAS